LLPALAGNGSRPAGGSAVTPRGATGNAGAPGDPPPPPRPMTGATMTGSVIGGIGRSAAGAPTPGSAAIADGSAAGGSCISGGSSGRPDGTSTPPPPPPPPPPGAGRPGGVVSLDVEVVVFVVVRVGDVVVFVLDDGGVVVFDGDVTLGGLDSELPPQCVAFPLLPSLPQFPLSGFPPLPGLSVAVAVAVLALEPPLPSGSAFGPLRGTSVECVPPGVSGDGEGSARANAPPRPHRNRPEATRQADAAPCTREPTSSPPPFKASTAW